MPILKPLLQRAIQREVPAPLLLSPLNIGHRGAAGEAPENTFAAFELALRQGADGIEFDVHLSADGVPVVIHDWQLERTTSGTGQVNDHPVKALQRLDAGSWFNRRYRRKARARYAGQKIPLLSEVLDWVRERKCLAFVEIKQRRHCYPGIEEKVLTEIYGARVEKLVTVISFRLASLRLVREMDPGVRLAVDFTRPILAIRRAKSLGAAGVVPYWAFVSRRFIRRSHRAGIQVLVWDLDEPRWMRRRIADGVDGIITNYPARLARIRAELETSRALIAAT